MRSIVALMGVLLLAAGCATPEYRIRKNPALFAAFPTNVQANVRSGLVDVGYTPDMVYIALGRPNRVIERTTSEGRFEIWVYTDITYSTEFAPIETTYWYRTHRGDLRLARDWSWIDVQQRHEYEILRVEFKDGKVLALEARK